MSPRSSLLGDILHLHEAGALSVTPVHACSSRPLLSILNRSSLFKHPNRKSFPGSQPAHLHEAGALSVTPVHACPSRPLLSILNSSSLFKHPNRKSFPGSQPVNFSPLHTDERQTSLLKCVARTEKNNPYLVLWTHAMTAFKRHEVDRCPTCKGENMDDG